MIAIAIEYQGQADLLASEYTNKRKLITSAGMKSAAQWQAG
jgi:hypothetical protein